MRVTRFLVAVLVAAVTLSIHAQQQPRKYTIAVAVDSPDGRIQQWAPELRSAAASVVEKSAHNVRAIIVTRSGKEAKTQAREQSADYLLRIELSPRPTASVPIAGGPGIQDPEIAGTTRANAQGAIFLAWTVEAVGGRKLKLHDSRYVQPAEYPLGPSFDWLHTIADRSTRDAAAAAMGELKSKKAIQP